METKLYELNSIEIWKEIARQVQRLNITEYGQSEFYKNLNKLRKLLFDIGINIYSKSNQEVGLETLLRSIYATKDVGIHYKKAKFYEQIYQLSDLGVKEIQFEPNFTIETTDSLYAEVDNGIYDSKIKKAYTDGIFNLYYSKHNNSSRMKYLTDLNYLLYFIVSGKEYNKYVQVEKGTAILSNFNGIYPSVDEVKSISFPKIYVPEQTIDWNASISNLKQSFEYFDENKASYQKRLTRTKDRQCYYKEYRINNEKC